MKVLIAVDQSDLAIMSFRSFMTQFAKDDMELQCVQRLFVNFFFVGFF